MIAGAIIKTKQGIENLRRTASLVQDVSYVGQDLIPQFHEQIPKFKKLRYQNAKLNSYHETHLRHDDVQVSGIMFIYFCLEDKADFNLKSELEPIYEHRFKFPRKRDGTFNEVTYGRRIRFINPNKQVDDENLDICPELINPVEDLNPVEFCKDGRAGLRRANTLRSMSELVLNSALEIIDGRKLVPEQNLTLAQIGRRPDLQSLKPAV